MSQLNYYLQTGMTRFQMLTPRMLQVQSRIFINNIVCHSEKSLRNYVMDLFAWTDQPALSYHIGITTNYIQDLKKNIIGVVINFD